MSAASAAGAGLSEQQAVGVRDRRAEEAGHRQSLRVPVGRGGVRVATHRPGAQLSLQQSAPPG